MFPSVVRDKSPVNVLKLEQNEKEALQAWGESARVTHFSILVSLFSLSRPPMPAPSTPVLAAGSLQQSLAKKMESREAEESLLRFAWEQKSCLEAAAG